LFRSAAAGRFRRSVWGRHEAPQSTASGPPRNTPQPAILERGSGVWAEAAARRIAMARRSPRALIEVPDMTDFPALKFQRPSLVAAVCQAASAARRVHAREKRWAFA